MTQLLSILTMSLNLNVSPAAAQFQPCVMPNPCGKIEVQQPVAQFQPCVMPNPCSKTEAPLTIEPVPSAVIGVEATEAPRAEEKPFRPCVYPNKCDGSDKVNLLTL